MLILRFCFVLLCFLTPSSLKVKSYKTFDTDLTTRSRVEYWTSSSQKDNILHLESGGGVSYTIT